MGARDYRLADGTRVGGVSEALDNYGPFLMRAPKAKLEAAAKVGTEVHTLIERALRGQAGMHPHPESNPEVLQACMAWVQWFANNDVKMLHCELALISETWRLGGTIDFVGYVNGELMVLDWKTCAETEARHRIQVTAYEGILRENFPTLLVDKIGTVRLDKKGGFPEMHTWEPSPADRRMWRTIVALRDEGKALKERFANAA